MLMGTGLSGSSPAAHDSSTTLATLMPKIARYRDQFYAQLLQRLSGKHGERLREEAKRTRQPLGGARQHLNHYLARRRARQLQQRELAVLFAGMGYPEASREEAAKIATISIRMLGQLLAVVTQGQALVPEGKLEEAAALLPQAVELLHRGIECGAFVDPWN